MLTEEEYWEQNKHAENMCDVCFKEVGKENLFKVPFIYLDKNDKFHEDLGDSYRQYYVCKECKRKGI